jgi:hypothetical protein
MDEPTAEHPAVAHLADSLVDGLADADNVQLPAAITVRSEHDQSKTDSSLENGKTTFPSVIDTWYQDPDNARNWPARKKWLNVAVVSLSVFLPSYILVAHQGSTATATPYR